MKKLNSMYCLIISILLIGLVGRLIRLGDSMWNFLFENLIWYSIEIFLTVVILNEAIAKRDEKKRLKNFILITGEYNDSLLYKLKDKLAKIVDNDYKNSSDEKCKYIFKEVLTNEKRYINARLVSEKREGKNYRGFIEEPCKEMIDAITDYMLRFDSCLPENYRQDLFELKSSISDAGLMFKGKFTDLSVENIDDGSNVEALRKIFIKVNELEKTLENEKKLVNNKSA